MELEKEKIRNGINWIFGFEGEAAQLEIGHVGAADGEGKSISNHYYHLTSGITCSNTNL